MSIEYFNQRVNFLLWHVSVHVLMAALLRQNVLQTVGPVYEQGDPISARKKRVQYCTGIRKKTYRDIQEFCLLKTQNLVKAVLNS